MLCCDGLDFVLLQQNGSKKGKSIMPLQFFVIIIVLIYFILDINLTQNYFHRIKNTTLRITLTWILIMVMFAFAGVSLVNIYSLVNGNGIVISSLADVVKYINAVF